MEKSLVSAPASSCQCPCSCASPTLSIVASERDCWQDFAQALAKSNRSTFAYRQTGHYDLVAVFQKRPLHSAALRCAYYLLLLVCFFHRTRRGRERESSFACPALFQQRSTSCLSRSRQCPCPHQITRFQRTSGRRVMSNHLADRIVCVSE